MARATCLMLLRPDAWRALERAWAKTGKRIAARIAMMAITTSSSMRVKPSRSGRDRGRMLFSFAVRTVRHRPGCRFRRLFAVEARVPSRRGRWRGDLVLARDREVAKERRTRTETAGGGLEGSAGAPSSFLCPLA